MAGQFPSLSFWHAKLCTLYVRCPFMLWDWKLTSRMESYTRRGYCCCGRQQPSSSSYCGRPSLPLFLPVFGWMGSQAGDPCPQRPLLAPLPQVITWYTDRAALNPDQASLSTSLNAFKNKSPHCDSSTACCFRKLQTFWHTPRSYSSLFQWESNSVTHICGLHRFKEPFVCKKGCIPSSLSTTEIWRKMGPSQHKSVLCVSGIDDCVQQTVHNFCFHQNAFNFLHLYTLLEHCSL